jgi:hypothetical protein
MPLAIDLREMKAINAAAIHRHANKVRPKRIFPFIFLKESFIIMKFFSIVLATLISKAAAAPSGAGACPGT